MKQQTGKESLADELLADESAEKTENDESNETSEKAGKKQKMLFEKLVQQAIGRYRAAMFVTDSITSRDVNEYEMYSYSDSTWNATGATTYAKRIEVVRESLEKWIPEMINKTKNYESVFYSTLNEAIESKWIGKETAEEWTGYLKSEETPHWEKESFVTKKFPKYVENWKKISKKREEILKKAQIAGISTRELPDLAQIINDADFLSRGYDESKNLLSLMDAKIDAHITQRSEFAQNLEMELRSWIQSGFLHGNKIGMWLDAAMKSGNPEAFVKTVLLPLKQNWQAAVARFAQLNAALSAQPLPRGFKPATQDEFLLMNDEQRSSYLVLAEIRLRVAQDTEKKLSNERAAIRHALDTKDWEGAEDQLRTARAQWPYDEEFHVMQTYVEAHKPKPEKKEDNEKTSDPHELNQDIRLLLRNLDGETYETHAWACTRGPKKAEALFNMMYNHLWEKETARLQAEEHRTVNEPIVVAQRGETAGANEEETLEVTSKEMIETRQIIDEQADEEEDDRTKSMTFESLSFERHRRIVKSLHNPLKRKLRELDKLGYRYSVTGDPRPKKDHATNAKAA